MKTNSKHILLWGIKILAERYFDLKFDIKLNYDLIKQTLALISSREEVFKTDYGEPGDQRFALRSIFTKTCFCENPALNGEGQFYLPPKIGLSKEIILPDKQISFNKNSLASEAAKELAQANFDTEPERLINLLFNYGANVPFYNEADCVLPLFDTIKILAALAAKPGGDFRLVIGDLSGIQNFIYTIDSRGALKVLRARSFYLELLTKSVAYEICDDLTITSANILYSGGGNFLLLLPEVDGLEQKIKSYYQAVNSFFLENFQGNVHLAIASEMVTTGQLNNIKDNWKYLHKNLERAKKKKFLGLLDNQYSEPQEALREECRICHTDDKKSAKIANDLCRFCTQLTEYGTDLKNIKRVTGRLSETPAPGLKIPSIHKNKAWYFKATGNTYTERKFQVNAIPGDDSIMMLYCDYVVTKKIGNNKIVTAEFLDLAQTTIGADLIGTLVMDVDNMGKVFSHGINTESAGTGNVDYLVLVPTLSRKLDYFFKYALTHICSQPKFCACENSKNINQHYKNYKRNISVIYSGGDDLLLTGGWNDVVEVAFDIQQKFEKYTCGNPDMGLSGGIYISQPKFPFYISVQKAGQAEKKAKGNTIKVNNGMWQGRDYSHSIIWNKVSQLADNNGPGVSNSSTTTTTEQESLGIKNSIFLFFDEVTDFQVDLIDEKDDLKKRFVRALKWDEANNKVKHYLSQFLSRELSEYDPALLNIKFEFPRSFITKLFEMVYKFQTLANGILYLPDHVYHYSRFESSLRNKVKPIFENYNRYDINKDHRNAIFYLPIILNWIELLIREKGAK